MGIEKAAPYRVMLDIETFSPRVDAVILSLGAVIITPELEIMDDPQFDDKFYIVIERAKSQEGRHIDIHTVEWWMKQDNYPTTTQNSAHLPEALIVFNDWFARKRIMLGIQKDDVEVWAKGTDFDIAILRDTYDALRIEIPWKYNMVRDLRTLLKTTKIPYPPKEENPGLHDALGDAYWQATQLIAVLKGELNGNQAGNVPT